MATNDVPGSNPANKDKLSRGCWAEHEDGSLLYVVDIDENDRVIFNMYDLGDTQTPVFYPHALALTDFEDTFSYNPKKKKKDIADIKWTHHDKTPFPWDKVMKVFSTPVPQNTEVANVLSAASRIAKSLKLRLGEVLTMEHLEQHSGQQARPSGNTGKTIRDRLRNAMRELVD